MTADADLAALRSLWLDDSYPRILASRPSIADDPFFSPSTIDGVLLRFLDAERGLGPKRKSGAAVVQSAAQRLEGTAAFRAEWDCVQFHRKGEARRLMMHSTNAGGTLYFGDAGLRASDGTLVLLGRSSLMLDADAPLRKRSDEMLAAQHLRAGFLVIERAAADLLERGAGSKGAYILDVGGYPTAEMAQFQGARYWDSDGVPDEVTGKRGSELPCAGPALPGHHELKQLAVLREAFRIAERFYPETLGRLIFYRPNLTFRAIFAVFRMWVAPVTRDRFKMVKQGEEAAAFFAPPEEGGLGLRPEDTPRELGGSGPSLDGDRFLLRACERYEATARLPKA